MITRNDAENLARAIHALRPDWPIAQLMTLLGEGQDGTGNLRDYPLRDLGCALTWIALDRDHDGRPVTASPYRILEPGPWFAEARDALELAQTRQRNLTDARHRARQQAADRAEAERNRATVTDRLAASQPYRQAARQAIAQARSRSRQETTMDHDQEGATA